MPNSLDNCPQVYNPTQSDGDGDGHGEGCDNCRFTYNRSQSDIDDDSEGDHCDLDDDLIYISFGDSAAVAWQSETGFDSWNAYRGDLSLLLSGGAYTQDPSSVPLADRICRTTLTSNSAGAVASGQAVFFLTTGSINNIESDLGTDSSGALRTNDSPCP